MNFTDGLACDKNGVLEVQLALAKLQGAADMLNEQAGQILKH